MMQIRNPKLEIRNKFELLENGNFKTDTGPGVCSFEFRVCFGFRVLDFGFGIPEPVKAEQRLKKYG